MQTVGMTSLLAFNVLLPLEVENMRLATYSAMMYEAGQENTWGEKLHPDLTCINVYYAGGLICEAPAAEDRSLILSLTLKEDGWCAREPLEEMQGETDWIFQYDDEYSLWSLSAERF